MDAAGYVNVVGRSKDMLIRSGENVYPREIEESLSTRAAIRDVAVIGVPDEKYGEEPCVRIVVRDGAQVSADGARAKQTGPPQPVEVARA